MVGLTIISLIRKIKNAVWRFKPIPQEIKEAIEPIISLTEQNDIREAEREIAKLVLDICSKVENKVLDPHLADTYFVHLDLSIHDSFGDDVLRQEVSRMLLEGYSFHVYGTKSGPNMDLIRKLANEVLQERNNRKKES